MRSKLWIMAVLLLILVPYKVFSTNDPTPMDELNELSDEALQLTKSQRYEDAKIILDTFSDKFSTYTIKNQSFTMEELRIVTTAHNKAVEATTSVMMDPDKRINNVTQFRLVIDAISSTKEPLWTAMKDPIFTIFEKMKNAEAAGDQVSFDENLNSFLTLYEIIYPSMKIDVEVERLQRLDTRVRYVDRYRSHILTTPNGDEELTALETELQTVFEDVIEDEADPSLWWVIISTGSIIILTLSYVGWRKYKGEREKKRNPSRD